MTRAVGVRDSTVRKSRSDKHFTLGNTRPEGLTGSGAGGTLARIHYSGSQRAAA